MKLELLYEFIELAKHLNFTNAAKELYISQPGLSMHLSTLEKELGFKLMNRSNSSVSLTPEGTVFLDYAQKIKNTYLEALATCSEIAADHPSLKICSLSQGSNYYRALLKIKSPSFTFVDLDLEVPFLKMLKRGVLDCGICFDYPHLLADQEDERFGGIEFASIGSSKLAICMMSTHPLAAKKELAKTDLKGVTTVIFSGNHFDDWQHVLQQVLGEDVGLTFHLNPVASLNNLALMNLGDMVYICGYESVVSHFSQRDDIVVFDTLDGKNIFIPDAFAHRSGDKLAEKLAKVLQIELKKAQ